MKRAQAVRLTAHAAVSFAAVLSISCLAVSQVPQKFSLLITKIERVNNGCVVQAQSSKVLFRVSSDISGPCSMLRVGETKTHQALRAVVQTSPTDETLDYAIVVVYNNVKNDRRDNAVVSIESEEALSPK
jgi:hypothetical protein